jgi:hypothetical protein
LLKFAQVLIVYSIRYRHHSLVKLIVARLVTADEQDGGASRVEGIENSVRLAAVLNP